MIFYRDKIEIEIDAKPSVYLTREGHVVEEYKVNGVKGFFVTLAGTSYCAHGRTLASAIADATWKDESKRPSFDEIKKSVLSDENRPITLNEFRLVTGACAEGCRVALDRKKLDGSPMKIKEIIKHFPEWGGIFCEKVGIAK